MMIYFIVPEGKFVVDTVPSIALQDSKKKKRQFTAKRKHKQILHTLCMALHITYSIEHIKSLYGPTYYILHRTHKNYS